MHMAQYLELCDTQHGYMQGWVMLGIAAKLGFSVCFQIPFRVDSVLILLSRIRRWDYVRALYISTTVVQSS